MSLTATQSPLPHPLALAISLIAAGSGAVAVVTYFTLYASMPIRIERVEEVNKVQEAKLTAIQEDAIQRREILAAAAATLQSIDQRTRRIEDRILSK
jgi:hypothetical protein